jgi:hypothetical protein
MLNRMLGAARLDPHTFEEVEADTSATLQAAAVVVIVAIATGIGSIGLGQRGIATAVVVGVLQGLITWVVWAFATYLIGTKLFPTPTTHASWGQLARTIGFAQTPGLLRVLGFIPVLGVIITIASYVWQFLAMLVAVRQALDYESTWRAFAVVLVGFLIVVVIAVIRAALFFRQAGVM